jgi:hypothetical protein
VAPDGRLRLVLAGLVVVSAAAFVIGREIERSVERTEQTAETSRPDEAGEGEAEEESGKLLGVDTDAPELTVVGVLLSLVLAVAVVVLRSRPLLWLVALFGLVFAGLDLFWELIRQIDKSNEKVAAAAAVVAVLHLAVTATAVVGLKGMGPPACSS